MRLTTHSEREIALSLLSTGTVESRSHDFWVYLALEEIRSTITGSAYDVRCEGRLLKFGENKDVDQAYETVMTLPSGVTEETYVSDNLITQVSSSNADDLGDFVVQGHTISGGVFTYVSQTVTLTGQVAANLTTPLARVQRGWNAGSTPLFGNVYVAQTDTLSGGVPDTAAKVHLIVNAGEDQSLKAASTTADGEWLLVTKIYASISDKSASSDAVVDFRIRLPGGVFRTSFKDAVSMGSKLDMSIRPFSIVPPNSDILVRALGNQNNTPVAAGYNAIMVRRY